MNIEIPISYGELLDKLSILEIKKEKISDKNKLENVVYEFNILKKLSNTIEQNYKEEFKDLYTRLIEINKKLWEIEDEIRILEANKDFNDEFIQLARSVYIVNDERFEQKKLINKTFGSEIMEEKQYINYK
tara:strand:+ start:834 stop:1226 length:393 start_codon:yes stop_codon:yes gene_type:complete